MDRRKFLAADLFCGAGGFSTSLQRALAALGIDMELVCVNHWGRAIDTHKANHPHARHYCEDIAAVRPHLVVPEGYLDVLTASPSCTHHSVARGGKPTSDQQRSDPWHIITWLTELDVARIAIENVWEFTSWGPVDLETRRPIAARKGEYFSAWINVIRSLGYEPEWRKVNAADFGEAQTRVRFLLMARKDGRRLIWPAATHAKASEAQNSLFAELKPWRPAREIIDWSLKGKSILHRPVPLAPKTLARILAGALKFEWPMPFIRVILRAIDESLRYHLTRNFSLRHEAGKKGKAATAKARDYARSLRHFREHPLHFAGGGSAEPLVVTLRRNADGRTADTPVPALAANGQHLALAEPIILSQHGSGAARPVSEPGPTITTGGAASEKRQGCARPMVVEPVVLTVAHGNDARESSPNARRANSPDNPLGTVHGDGVAYGLVQPFMLSRHSDGAPRLTGEPMPTQTTVHSPVLVAAYYGANANCKPVEEPLDTVPTKDRFGLVVPVTHSQGGNSSRSLNEPIQTITTAKGGELAFIAAQFGEREGQVPRVHDLGNPSPSVTATGHMNLVEAVAGDENYDVLFRMFETHELAAAQGMDDYVFTGTKTEIVKQIGNGVSRRKMEAHLLALCADAAPDYTFQQAAD